jgi:hypothetical protein
MERCRSCGQDVDLPGSCCAHSGAAATAHVPIGPPAELIAAQPSRPGEGVGPAPSRERGDGATPDRAGPLGDEKGPWQAWNDRRLRLKGLDRRLRLLLWAAIAQTVIVAVVLLMAHVVPQPSVDSSIGNDTGGTYLVPLAVFVLSTVSIAAGYVFVVAGALRVRPLIGLPIVAMVVAVLGFVPVSVMRNGILEQGVGTGPYRIELVLRWAQIGVLGLLCAGALAVTFAQRTPPGTVGDARLAGRLSRPIVIGVVSIVVTYYVLEVGISVAYAGAGMQGIGGLRGDLAVQTVLLLEALTLVALLGSTDLLEWGELVAVAVVRKISPAERPHVFVVLTPLVALVMIANVLHRDGYSAVVDCVVGAVLLAVGTVVLRHDRHFGTWSDSVRSRAVLLGAAVIFALTTIMLTVTSAIGSHWGLAQDNAGRLSALVSTPLAVAGLTITVLVVARRRHKPRHRVLTLFTAVVLVFTLVAGALEYVQAGHPHATNAWHFLLLDSVQLTAAAGTLGWFTMRVVRGQAGHTGHMLARVFLLLVGFQTVSWMLDVTHGIANLGARSPFLLAGLFLLTVGWTLSTSGGLLTDSEANTRRYPRDGRIMLFVGSTLVSNAVLLYLGSLDVPAADSAAAESLTNDVVTPAGLVILGSSLVVLAFVVRIGTSWRSQGEDASTPQSRLVRRGILVGGAVTTIVVVGVSFRSLPTVMNATTTPVAVSYATPVPGPGCDGGDTSSVSGPKAIASWTVTAARGGVTTHCRTGGFEVDLEPNVGATISFTPPAGTFPHNYAVSVHANLIQLSVGCVELETRVTAAGGYVTSVCRPDAWAVEKVASASTSGLAGGTVPRADGYTIGAISDGANQRMTINGATVGDGVDPTLTATSFLGLTAFNFGTQPSSVIFSDFHYAPLPGSG